MLKAKRFALLAVSCFLFFSCSWFNNDAVQPLPVIPVFNTFTITGNLTTNGAMPENFAQALNSRTAIATAPTGQTIQYKVLLLAASGATNPIAGASSESDGTSYTIKYTGTDTTAVRYWLRAVAYYMNGSDEVDILVSPDTQLETAVDLKGGVFTKDLEMRPATSGYGEVELNMTLASATMCDSITISDDTHFEITGTGTDRKIVHKATSVENPKVASGSYTVTVSFYKNVSGFSSPFLVYQFDDVINVFNNLTTNKWVDNGNSPHLTTTGSGDTAVTSCSITNSMLTDFNITNFYVDNRKAAIGEGTFLNPFNSLYAAISYINATGNNTTSYTIHIKGDSSGSIKEWYSYPYQINKRITLETYIDVPGRKDGIIYFEQRDSDTGTLFDVQAGGVLTFDSNGEAAGISGSHATKGIMLKVNDTSVEVHSGGKFVMKGGRITATVSDNSEGRVYLHQPNAGAQTIFEMSGGAIEGFLYPSTTGVLLETGATIKLHGKPYIYNNSRNLYLPSTAKIIVDGPFREGALIGVTTVDPPTAALPVIITQGYGYQTGGYNAGVKPGRYFRGDQYGVTDDGDPDSGEAVLAISGGSISTKLRENITIDIDKKIASKTNEAAKKFTFTVTKDKGAVAPATSTDLTSATGITYSYTLKDYTDEVVSPTYYSKEANTVTITGNIPTGKYRLIVRVSYNGCSYNTSFDVSFANVSVPEGCVATPVGYWAGAATLCAGDSNKKSYAFIAGRKLSIPILIAGTHEVTKGEYTQYCKYVNTTKTPSTGNGFPSYWISWFDAIVYCNLRTLNDSTFGTTREQRLSHCAYSLNGEKDPVNWPGIEAGTGEDEGKYCAPTGSGVDQDISTAAILAWDSGIKFDLTADGWRLPTSVEWEYLGRGGNLTDENQFIWSGTDTYSEIAGDTAELHEYGAFPANELGLYDMCGNLEECVWDWTYNYTDVTATTPITGITPSSYPGAHLVRGGSYQTSQNIAKLQGWRNDAGGWIRYDDLGFRVVRTVQ